MKLALLCGLLLLSGAVPAQEKDPSRTWHNLSLQFGVNQIRDENLHPKVSTGTITEFSYGFEKRRKNWQKFHLTLGYSRLKTKLEDLSKTINLKINLGYSNGFRLTHGAKFLYYLGPEVTLAYNDSYLPNWDDSHFYWADYLSVGVRNSFWVKVKSRSEWVSDISVPLFSVFSRPDLYRLYKIDDTSFGGMLGNLNSNITAAHLTNVFFVLFRTEYRFPVFKNQVQAFTYSFEWVRVRHDDGNPYNQLSNQIGIKFYL